MYFEASLSDFHKLVLTILRSKFEPFLLKIIGHTGPKKFDVEKLKTIFQNYFSEMSLSDMSLYAFKLLLLNVLNKFALVKKKLHLNHSRFVHKSLVKHWCIEQNFIIRFLKKNLHKLDWLITRKKYMCNYSP